MNRLAAPQKIGSIVESFLSDRGYLTICRENQAVGEWPRIVGEEVARVTRCDRVEAGTLYVRVESAPWRQELSYMKGLILDKVRAECATIKEIVFF